MDNQHRKIKGYRELSQEEISLMNRIKEKGAELLALQAELQENLCSDLGDKEAAVDVARTPETTAEAGAEYNRFRAAEPMRWAAIGKTDIETGIMALVRAVAQPG
jgi:hypothetical protein